MKIAPYYPLFLVILAITLLLTGFVIKHYQNIMTCTLKVSTIFNCTLKVSTIFNCTLIISIVLLFILFEKLLINSYITNFSQPQKYLVAPDNDRVYDISSFNMFDELHVNWRTVREEALNVYKTAPLTEISRSQNQWKVVDQDLLENMKNNYGWIKAWSANSSDPNVKWLNYGLYHKTTGWFTENIKKCPETHKLLSKFKNYINIAGFSLMKGISRIDPHTDSTGKSTNSLAYHMGLIVPEPHGSCTLVVDNYTIIQKEGQQIIFDSNYEHFAVNDSTQDRIVLYIDFKLK